MENKPTVKEGIVLSIILTIALLGFSIISGKLGLVNVWAGCMFFWYWANIDDFKMDHIKENVIGSLTGVLLCFGLYLLVQNYGKSVFELGMIAVLLVVLFFCITDLLPIIFNKATFLFITVLTAHQFIAGTDYLDLLLSYAFGVAFFSIGLGLVFKLLHSKKTEKA